MDVLYIILFLMNALFWWNYCPICFNNLLILWHALCLTVFIEYDWIQQQSLTGTPCECYINLLTNPKVNIVYRYMMV